MNKKLFFLYLTVGLTVLPTAAFAFNLSSLVPAPTYNQDAILLFASSILDLMWTVFAVLSVIAFIIAGLMFVTANGEPGRITQARSAVIWGIVGTMVALISVALPWILKQNLGV